MRTRRHWLLFLGGLVGLLIIDKVLTYALLFKVYGMADAHSAASFNELSRYHALAQINMFIVIGLYIAIVCGFIALLRAPRGQKRDNPDEDS